MDKVEEILPRIAAFLRDDLSKEPLSSKAEKKRLYYVSRIDQAMQDAAAQEINNKYEPMSSDSGGVERRSNVPRGNILPTPLFRISLPPPPETKIAETKITNQHVMVAYEVLPCDQTYEEVGTRDIYEEATIHGTHSTSSISTSNGIKHPPIHPPHPPPLPPVRPPSPPPVYDEAFQLNTERIHEASDSDNDTDYEVYDEAKDEDVADKNKESHPVRHNSSKLKNKGRQQGATADLTGKRHTGYLHQKGTFQFQRRFCALCGTRFLACKSESSLKVIVEVNVTEYEVVLQERREGKTSAYPHELRFSCPGKETYLFYTESRQAADDWVKELRRASTLKQDSVEANNDSFDSVGDDADRQSINSETSTSGGSIDKTKVTAPNASDDVRKKSKLQSLLGTFGKKLGNKTKNFFQGGDFSNPQQAAVETDQEFGYVSIRSEEFTGDRWLRRFCRIEEGHLNCYLDSGSTEVRPEFGLHLRGAQLKPLGNELKIKLVKDGKEHDLKMFDFMHHGRWLRALIGETGFATQLAAKSLINKDIYEEALQYEELPPLFVLGGVTEDDTSVDDDPPPLPTASPPSSPMPDPSDSHRDLNGSPKKHTADPEGIYLQPSEWLPELEELKRKQRWKQLNAVARPVEEEEESAYINRDFARKALNSREKVPKMENHTEKGSINSSSSYPNLTSLGMIHDGEGTSGKDASRQAGGAGGKDIVAGKTGGKFRPSSALVESLENLADNAGSKNCRGKGVEKGSSHSFDRSVGFLNQAMRKQDDQFTGVVCQKKLQDKSSSKIIWDEFLRNNNRRKTSGSESSDDLGNKKIVQNLVQMFEKKV